MHSCIMPPISGARTYVLATRFRRGLHVSSFVENLKFYASIDNLFTITGFPGFDPEIGANVGYPAVRQYSVGVNITF